VEQQAPKISTGTDLIIVSGMSGSGKSIVLHALEDLGYYCIDNLPAVLLPQLVSHLREPQGPLYSHSLAAVSIDSRNRQFLEKVPANLQNLRDTGLKVRVIFLQSDDKTLIRRYSETRRKHPLTDNTTPLVCGITEERRLLAPLEQDADRRIDTTRTNPVELRSIIRDFAEARGQTGTKLVLKSFGFKYGAPMDADYLFDIRCLPNPYWKTELRDLSGLDEPVVRFFHRSPLVTQMVNQIAAFLEFWLPYFDLENRSYLMVALGCTGGQHRSVFVTEELASRFRLQELTVQTDHRDLYPVSTAVPA
jgi:UPF0042 nucleotide-binding protein